MLVLCGRGDDGASIVRAGEALSALLLEATAQGLATTPITQVLEVPETRQRVGEIAGGGGRVPLAVVRLGRPAPGSPPPPRTPRRGLEAVLDDRSGSRG